MNIVHAAIATSFRHAQCLHCGHEILLARHVGWIELYPGESYDICPDDEDGRHQPDLESDTELPYWMTQETQRCVSARLPDVS
ncbi:MAG: hypothetical protein NTV23_04800 [Propionibacteriales bacterium]|nr:hypothetical protein [Propionibacteriales bacterium]